MNGDQLVYETLSDSGIPGARMTWGPKSCVPPLPYFTYERRAGSAFADNESVELPRYRATLFTTDASEPCMREFESQLAELGPHIKHPARREGDAYAHVYDFSL